jgi:adenylate cyclase
MKLEIERKFLVPGTPWTGSDRYVEIEQGYLSMSPRAVVRVRYETVHSPDGTVVVPTGRICIKNSSHGLVREEYEYEIPHCDAARMIYAMSQHRIIKRRYFIQHGTMTWHVDQFLDDNQPLVLAEIELEHPDQLVDLPEWIGPEVTGDQRYSNLNLAISPWIAQ